MSELDLGLAFGLIVFAITNLIDYCNNKRDKKNCLIDGAFATACGFWAGHLLAKYIERVIGG